MRRHVCETACVLFQMMLARVGLRHFLLLPIAHKVGSAVMRDGGLDVLSRMV